MVERSTTTTVTNVFGSSSRPLDRALGVAVTASAAVLVVQYTVRYIGGCKEGDHPSWLHSVLSLLKSLVFETNERFRFTSSKDDTMAVHRGACHCRSVRFEFHAIASIQAKDGGGKIHYPHAQVPAGDFRFLSGGDELNMYYVSVPASTDTNGVEPVTAAFAFCGRCGVHVLHAPSAHSNTLDVNVDCLDSADGTKVPVAPRKHNLSQGVPITNQWDYGEHDLEDDMDSRVDLFTLGQLTTATTSTALTEDNIQYVQDPIIQAPTPQCNSVDSSTHQMESPAPDMIMGKFGFSPGTPTTVGTTPSTDLPKSLRSVSSANSSEDLDQSNLKPILRLLPPSRLAPIDTGLPAETPKAKSTTPMMRDQLKYYMSKHVTPSGKKPQHIPPAEGDSS